ncbi:MAG: RHS repeat-associated core domain-containing protein, partial [Segetibacter sp.]
IWEKEARYNYYKHGPLATTIYGQQQIQSVINAYTLQGWMKGTIPGNDANTQIAKQAFNYGLGYFAGDYKAIGNITPFASVNKGNDLYNGNIKAMLVNVPKVGEAVLHSYKYDQLNRIKEVNNYAGYNATANTWTATQAHKEALTFDPNGNIQTALLNGSANNLPYESFTYNYDLVKKNRLLSIANAVDGSTKAYTYNEIGEATKDELEGNSNLQWNLYGKLQSVTKTNGTVINYSYDAGGNRISKTIAGGKTEFYVRDASGNIMATYQKATSVNNNKLSTQSYNMYGSNMLGAWEKVRDVETLAANNNENLLTRGEQKIYFGNHLGNNLLVLTDKKNQIQDPNNPTQISGYNADVAAAADYSAYGENLIGREFNGSGVKYGFNNKLKDPESGYQDYGMRVYSSKARRFPTVDPITKKFPALTPYQFASNNPVEGIDLDGLEYISSKEARIEVIRGNVMLKVENMSTVVRKALNNYKNNTNAAGQVGGDLSIGHIDIAGMASTFPVNLVGAVPVLSSDNDPSDGNPNYRSDRTSLGTTTSTGKDFSTSKEITTASPGGVRGLAVATLIAYIFSTKADKRVI